MAAAITNDLGQPIGFPVPDWSGAPAPMHTSMLGRTVRLEPLSVTAHGADLAEAYACDSDGRMWTYMPAGPFNADPDGLENWLSTCEKSENMFYAIVSISSGKALGHVSHMRIVPANGVMEVGNVTMSPALQGTIMSTEAQFLLMQKCFGLGYRRYEWKCDALNAPSRKAAERLGFTFEGIFRQALVYKGRNRDTAWFSILDADWPHLREAFTSWLDPSNFDAGELQKKTLKEFRCQAQ